MPSMATVKSKTKKLAKALPKKSALARRSPEVQTTKLAKTTRAAAQTGIRRAVSTTQKVVKDHKLAVGTLIGAGVLVGVAARAMRGSSSPMSDAVEAITSGVTRASNQARKSLKKATSNVRRALK